jgi:hypothetical protein
VPRTRPAFGPKERGSNSLRTYPLDPDTYFAGLPAYLDGLEHLSYGYVASRELCEAAMRDVISSFGLLERRVLSLGPAFGHEDYWLSEVGRCTLTLADLDESGSIEPYLESLPKGEGLTYLIGSAYDSQGEFDVVYASSFTPDEIRRGHLQRKPSLWKRAFNRAVRPLLGRNVFLPRWPVDAPAFDPAVLDLLSRVLAPGGLFINQSFYSSFDAADKQWLRAAQDQLAAAGLSLCAVYGWDDPRHPGVQLTVARRGDRQAFQTPASFHGRGGADSRKGVRVCYPPPESD